MASLLAKRIREQPFLFCSKPKKILKWDEGIKGIDETLLTGCTLNSQKLAEWLEQLSPACLDQVNRQPTRNRSRSELKNVRLSEERDEPFQRTADTGK